MYFVLHHKIAKFNMGTRTTDDKFAPRTANSKFMSVSGPFSKRSTAERAVVASLSSVHSIGSEVWTADAIRAELASSTGVIDDMPLQRRLRVLLRQTELEAVGA